MWVKIGSKSGRGEVGKIIVERREKKQEIQVKGE